MKFLRFDANLTGLLIERGAEPAEVLDVRASLPVYARSDAPGAALIEHALGPDGSGSWVPLIENWDAARAPLEAMLTAAHEGGGGLTLRALAGLRMRPPLPSPATRVFATGINFRTHVSGAGIDPEAEREQGLHPIGFFVIPGTIAAPGERVGRPIGVQKLDYEAEVAAVLRSGGQGMDASEVMVWGVTGFDDLSIRDKIFGRDLNYDRGPLSIALAKNFQGANPLGPWIVVDELDADDLRFGSRVNGELRQEGSTSAMAYSFGDIAHYLSRWIRLAPGDMLTSGTPGGTAAEGGADGPFLRDGDVVEVFLDGVGVLSNEIVTGDARGAYA
jgi:2-keto-4-pentenoate hydratase/2-oxohepta-3-ene-1,7-dioic acid hydratase in catechol pathway